MERSKDIKQYVTKAYGWSSSSCNVQYHWNNNLDLKTIEAAYNTKQAGYESCYTTKTYQVTKFGQNSRDIILTSYT